MSQRGLRVQVVARPGGTAPGELDVGMARGMRQTLEVLWVWYGLNFMMWQLFFLWLAYPVLLLMHLLGVGKR
jgi:hypothetical protein